jgi:hypothetical protein
MTLVLKYLEMYYKDDRFVHLQILFIYLAGLGFELRASGLQSRISMT